MSTEPKDSELLGAYVRQQSDGDFRQLVERHVSLVYGTALRRLGNAALAEDVVQKTFATLSRRAIWLLSHPCLSGWLHRTAVHLAKQTARSEGRRRQREQIAMELGTTVNSKNEITEELTPVLDEILLELRAKDREALLLRFMANKSHREVGAALGIQEDAAQKRVAKALTAIADKFRRRGFRVAGTAAIGTLLQSYSLQAVPAGLVATTANAVAGMSTTASLGILTTTTLKLMSLNNAQTFGLCLAIVSVPLGHQWHSLNERQDALAALNQQLSQRQEFALSLDNEFAAATQIQEDLEAKRAALQSALDTEPPKPPAVPKNLYVWNEASEYVRIPRKLLNTVRFGAFVTRTNRHGQPVRDQAPPLDPSGAIHPSLSAALGLTDTEHERLNALNETAFEDIFDAMASNTRIEEGPFVDDGRKVTLTTESFADYGQELRRWYRSQLHELLGEQRAELFWTQANRVFSDTFNEFGRNPRTLQLIDRIGQPLTLMEGYQGSHNIGELARHTGRIYPPQFQEFIDLWTAERNAIPSHQ